jgi:hypothetical protein
MQTHDHKIHTQNLPKPSLLSGAFARAGDGREECKGDLDGGVGELWEGFIVDSFGSVGVYGGLGEMDCGGGEG